MDINALAIIDQKVNLLAPGDETKLLALLAELDATIRTLEGSMSREQIIAQIPCIRSIAATSPFVHRAQRWPKGYQGDYETIDHIIAQKNKAVPNTLGYAVEDFFLRSDICKQHNNKVSVQSSLIAAALKKDPAAKIVSIGCGTSEDIRSNIGSIKNSTASFLLIDIDDDAIAHSQEVLQEISDNITVLQGNIYRLVRKLTDSFDLVIIGGVFDYLSDKVIVSILSSLKERLNAEGAIFFTNIAKPNPYRIYMEYVADWVLIERSEEDILRLIKESGCDKMQANILLESTALTWLVKLNLLN